MYEIRYTSLSKALLPHGVPTIQEAGRDIHQSLK
jgi:hypothetical protein